MRNILLSIISLLQLLHVFSYSNSFDLSLAERYVQFAGVAYCTNPTFTTDTVENWTCHACKAFPNVTASSFHALGTDANGFVAYDHNAKELILSFSGTNPVSIRDWLDDLELIKVKYPLCNNECEVHYGFYNTYNTVKDDVRALVKQYYDKYAPAKISVTGHSLGAALAAMGGADLVSLGYKIHASYTYGMPRVGDEDYEKWYTSFMPGTFRVVHRKDPVPQVPLQIQGYHHFPYEVFYEKDYNKWTLCSSDGEDPDCSNKYAASLDVLDHLTYLQFDFTSNWFTCPNP